MTSLGAFLATALLGWVLLYAGLGKLVAGRAEVERLVAGYGLLGPSVRRVAASVAPVLEIVVGAWLLIAPLAVVPGLLAALMLTVFTVAIIAALKSGRSVPCGCFGASKDETVVSWATVGRNAFLLGAAAFATGYAAWGSHAGNLVLRTSFGPLWVSTRISMALTLALLYALLGMRRLSTAPSWNQSGQQVTRSAVPRSGSRRFGVAQADASHTDRPRPQPVGSS